VGKNVPALIGQEKIRLIPQADFQPIFQIRVPGSIFSQAQLFAGLHPLPQNNFAVPAGGKMHRRRAIFQIIRHF
jgi:hypothetical protein